MIVASLPFCSCLCQKQFHITPRRLRPIVESHHNTQAMTPTRFTVYFHPILRSTIVIVQIRFGGAPVNSTFVLVPHCDAMFARAPQRHCSTCYRHVTPSKQISHTKATEEPYNYLIDHESTTKLGWDIFMMALIIFSSFASPLQIGERWNRKHVIRDEICREYPLYDWW